MTGNGQIEPCAVCVNVCLNEGENLRRPREREQRSLRARKVERHKNFIIGTFRVYPEEVRRLLESLCLCLAAFIEFDAAVHPQPRAPVASHNRDLDAGVLPELPVHIFRLVGAEIERVVPFHHEAERTDPRPALIDGGDVKDRIGLDKLKNGIHGNLHTRSCKAVEEPSALMAGNYFLQITAESRSRRETTHSAPCEGEDYHKGQEGIF